MPVLLLLVILDLSERDNLAMLAFLDTRLPGAQPAFQGAVSTKSRPARAFEHPLGDDFADVRGRSRPP